MSDMLNAPGRAGCTSTDTCGCGEGLAVATPKVISNRPGLSSLSARTGDYNSLRQTLIARLGLSHQTVLAGLTTRDSSDFTIGLLDAWASVGDVLTFYQERIANEAYLGTATERLSVQELARLVDYQLRPGLAASACLAFTVEDPPGTTRKVAPTADALGSRQQNAAQMGVPEATVLEVGLKVQSVPGPGQTAQIFETSERIEARASWNAIKPRLTQRQDLAGTPSEVRLEGLTTGLRKGDALLLPPVRSEDGKVGQRFCRITWVMLDNYNQCTRLGLSTPLDDGTPAAMGDEPAAAASPILSLQAQQLISRRIVKAADLQVTAMARRFATLDVFDNLHWARAPAAALTVLRCRAAIFGHNAPDWNALPATTRIGEVSAHKDSTSPSGYRYEFEPGVYSESESNWAETKLDPYPGGPEDCVYLDAVYPTITAGSWVVLVDGATARACKVEGTTEISKSYFTLSGKLTQLKLPDGSDLSPFSIRGTTVFGESEALPLARQPISDAVAHDVMELDGLVDGLRIGQKIALCGELQDERGVTACEIGEIAEVEHDFSDAANLEAYTRITLKNGLKRRYVRSTVSINANVALATHGEAVATFGAGGEALGSGDATKPFQRFTLAQAPLTYVSAATDSGMLSTLQVRVQGLLWQEVPTLYGRAPDERVYITRTSDDGKTSVVFGDGINGARLPTGNGNVTANYRKGSGSAGRLAANQLTQLLTRPLGLKSVTNPVAAEGGADPQTLEQARRSAPLGVLTLGRIVSLQDYEDFACAFAGLGKAMAMIHPGGLGGVLVTAAGADGAQLEEGGEVLDKLSKAMQANGDPLVPLAVKPFVPRAFRLTARVATDPTALRETVLAAAEAALRTAFAFAQRGFCQPVHASEVVAVIQQVPGVRACALDELYVVPLAEAAAIEEEESGAVHAHLPAAGSTASGSDVVGAELLLLDTAPIKFGVLA